MDTYGDPSAQEPHSIPFARRHQDYPSPRSLPNWRTSPQLDGDINDTRVPRTHNQGTLASVHRLGIPFYL